ncbi:hypothetical protein SLEP1_g16473 [Rubroshorea leprosula]|uniref:Fe2OG dioxygenase domain-containing protein n=1 Tax=Rubroshorea leprosula TaxID=152421 RepID=A0AAV5IWY7_9ROSI|nr:hypothetical protein SLEP1_g16473 [Rubroshorea leprosula]
MGSRNTLRLPVIDFSTQELEWDLVKGQVREALEEYGAFEALFDKVPNLELWQAIFGTFEEIFDLPLEIKRRNVYRKSSLGYIGQSPVVPLYESIAVDRANVLEKVDQGFTNILFPEGNPTLSKNIQSFTEQVAKLDEIIRRMILESFGLEKYMDEHLNSTTYTLRGFKYTSPKTTESKVGLIPHQDKNMISILYQLNEVDGLEIQTKDGEWISVKASPESFIVVIGESLHAWLNGRLSAVYHRVMMTGDKARYSLGLFSVAKDGYLVKAPEEMVDEEHPLLYKPFDFAKFLEYLGNNRKQGGQKVELTLKAYCGA